ALLVGDVASQHEARLYACHACFFADWLAALFPRAIVHVTPPPNPPFHVVSCTRCCGALQLHPTCHYNTCSALCVLLSVVSCVLVTCSNSRPPGSRRERKKRIQYTTVLKTLFFFCIFLCSEFFPCVFFHKSLFSFSRVLYGHKFKAE
ncbi:unnamed protein product, partial [Ectocarpus fasciculatus]